MFGDWGVNVRVIQEQEERFEAWLGGLPKGCKLAIVEVGRWQGGADDPAHRGAHARAL